MKMLAESVSIRILKANKTGKFIELIKLFEIGFLMQDFSISHTSHISKVLNKYSFSAESAEIDGLIIGGAIVYTLDQYYSVQPLAYIYNIAIKEEFQSKVLAKKKSPSLLNISRKGI